MVYAKALTAGVVALLGLIGVTGEMSVREAVMALIMAVVVWFVPNKKK